MSDLTISAEQLQSLIARAFDGCRGLADDPALDARRRNATRSKNWVEGLAAAFREHYRKDDPDVRVFSKYHADNRSDFTLNELLDDDRWERVGDC